MDFNLYRPLLDAAMNGKWESVEDFINSQPSSVEIPITECGRTALHIAAGAGHSNVVLKLLERMHIPEALESIDNYDGNTALHLAVIAGLDEAVEAMVQKRRNLAHICNKKGLNPLHNAAEHVGVEHTSIIRFLCGVMMADEKPSSFQGHLGAHLICSITRADLYGKNGSPTFKWFILFAAIHSEKLNDSIYLPKLLDFIFEEIACMTREDMRHFSVGSNFLKTAAENGAIEIVKKCVKTYPDQLWFPHEGRNIFQIAVENRQEKIFNYLYDHMNADEKILATRIVDSNGGNILHVAAKNFLPSRRSIFTSPVIQMQSEISWFKKVQKRVPPAFRKRKNKLGETPQEVFTREHKDLVKTGEAHLIRTAESCLIVAALVATVAFAAIFTVPGGNFSDKDIPNKGEPIFLGKKSFVVFMVVDALALLLSTTSILVFLSIFAESYEEANFEIILPKKLAIGLASLIVSVLSVIIAFNMAISIILGSRYVWAPYLVGGVTFYGIFLIFELTVFIVPVDPL
ncbi:hypothetical protein MKX03_014908 [Papaver bracteatum]|nr:hypothetical protein MKX03_014908 [Papaver bracteatum]